MYTLIVTHRAHKQFLKLHPKDQERIDVALSEISEDPYVGKALSGDGKGMFAYRVWPYRIVYVIGKKTVTVTVVTIGHRKDVYRKIRL